MGHSCTVVKNRYLYIFGGGMSDRAEAAFNDIWIFDTHSRVCGSSIALFIAALNVLLISCGKVADNIACDSYLSTIS